MNYKYILFFIAIVFFSCSKPKSNLDKAKEAVTEQLKETMHDWKSYEPVKWGSLDSAYSSFGMLPEYKEASDKLIESNKNAEESLSNAKIYVGGYSSTTFNRYIKEAKEYNKEALEQLTILKNIEDTFKSKFIGYAIEHSYRGKNAEGNKIITHKIFYLDTLFKSTMIRDNSDTEDDDKKNYPSIRKSRK